MNVGFLAGELVHRKVGFLFGAKAFLWGGVV